MTPISAKLSTALLLALAAVGLPLRHAHAQSPGVLYTWSSAGIQDWFRNFGAVNTSATLANLGPGALTLIETSAAAGGSQAFSDGFNTVREGLPFSSGCCGGLDLTGLVSLEFVMGHNGVSNVNVQFFTQATPSSTFLALGPDLPVAPGINTYTVPLSGLTAQQITYMRTIGCNIRDHSAQGNLTWTIQEVRSAGTPLSSRAIANHNSAGEFNGVNCIFDCSSISGGTNAPTIVNGALEWVDLAGSTGAGFAYGNGTENAAGSYNARPVDLSNYDIVWVRMKASGSDPTIGVQFFTHTGSAFTRQVAINTLPVDGAYHSLVYPLAGFINRSYLDSSGVDVSVHANNLIIDIDNIIFARIPSLAIAQAVTNVVITWPTNHISFTLQSTTNLVPPIAWTMVTPSPVVTGGLNRVTNALASRRLYRLLAP